MKNITKGRSNSKLEILRITLLAFLIFTHFFDDGSLLDIRVIQHLSFISVNGFALITGMFVYRKRSLFYRNISRLIFIVIFSIIIGLLMSISKGFRFSDHWVVISSGSMYIWYIYAILPVYFIAPKIFKWVKKTSTPILLLIASPLYAIGAAAQYVLYIGGTKLFYFTWVGLIFSAIWLFSLSLFGFVLKRHSDITFKTKILILLLIFIPLEIGDMFLFLLTKWSKFGHGDILLTMSAASLIMLVANSKWQSARINALSKRMYFVYEYHWYWIMLWNILFPNFITENHHLQFYVGYVAILLLASVTSIAITELQLKVWNKYVDPQMLKAISWTKSKLMSPKVSN